MTACDYDAELRRHDAVLRAACGVAPDEQVLDIGCGTGHTTREAARTARAALGVDISARAVERARELAAGLDNVTFVAADAQVHPFPPARFDLAMSRFGTMFFADPAAAFANIHRALRPGGRLVMLVWQAHDRNEWDVALHDVLGGTAAEGPDPFTLADPTAVRRLLAGAGFTDVGFTDVDEPVYYGADVAAALAWVRGFTCTSELLNRLDPAAAARAVDRLRAMLSAHLTDDGVWFDSRAWLVTARRH
ncbi:methyltransferase domain-containing protein [Asanoa sp. WMMD1127]|uniref:class I SAM-dependent methyltransferase n=1 Tax=Asanoa sp. WMMD1127 TaxID=3016107 RepID=UPI002416A720|nr:class I SAM-dependent methyltransferase [Asanoa sp. WMMD1127]MDG4824580.1 methyltransferase domain-containing protein [Asanoa sp. WMMD1127]